MLLGFYRRFAGYVWQGSKVHTIRLKRKIEPRVGEVCYSFVDTRQKTMARLGNWTCTKVDPILIAPPGSMGLGIWISGEMLSEDERNTFCWMDGFRPPGSTAERPGDAYVVFERYWIDKSVGERALPFVGHLIHWAFCPNPISAESREIGRAPMPAQLTDKLK